MRDGAGVGVGAVVGLIVGALLGADTVGDLEGVIVLGVKVGLIVGFAVGIALVGLAVGIAVTGALVGAIVGTIVGSGTPVPQINIFLIFPSAHASLLEFDIVFERYRLNNLPTVSLFTLTYFAFTHPGLLELVMLTLLASTIILIVV